jgi:hypothetical protein
MMLARREVDIDGVVPSTLCITVPYSIPYIPYTVHVALRDAQALSLKQFAALFIAHFMLVGSWWWGQKRTFTSSTAFGVLFCNCCILQP